MTSDEIDKAINNNKNFVGILANVTTPIYSEFNKRLNAELKKNYRSKKTDIICLPFGIAHENALDNIDCVTVESGIGYENSYKDFRIFESYAKLHYETSKENKNYQYYWFVVPNYYNILEWPLNLNPDQKKIGYFGRICDVKGCNIIVEIANKFPHIDFILCGQGDPSPYLVLPNIKYKMPIHGTERSEYLGSLLMLISPSLYMEPFCGVNVEAQLCGTPILTNEFGAFVETVEQFKTGLMAHTLQDYCHGIQMVIDGKFDRKYIRDRAVKLYDMYNVAHKYKYVFDCIIDIYNGNNGWYSNNDNIKLLQEKELY
jgi:glycosyltransferase involved in cell wall biosynthesis